MEGQALRRRFAVDRHPVDLTDASVFVAVEGGHHISHPGAVGRHHRGADPFHRPEIGEGQRGGRRRRRHGGGLLRGNSGGRGKGHAQGEREQDRQLHRALLVGRFWPGVEARCSPGASQARARVAGLLDASSCCRETGSPFAPGNSLPGALSATIEGSMSFAPERGEGDAG